jgi:predicted DNA-binding transcriptional regulator AlpA
LLKRGRNMDISKPLYTLTIAEFLELTRKTVTEQAEKLLVGYKRQSAPGEAEKPDIIFIDEVRALTGLKRSTIYSKVSRYEIPVVSRRKPLTFSRMEILQWIKNGKPTVAATAASEYSFKRKK